MLTTPLGAETLWDICMADMLASETCAEDAPNNEPVVFGWNFGMGSMERLWDVGIPALRTSVAEVLRIRSVLFQISPVD